MQIRRHYPLKAIHTFHMDVHAEEYARFTTERELLDFLVQNPDKVNRALVLGGGSNILFKRDFEGIILHIETSGKEMIDRTDHEVSIRVQSGEDWDAFVAWCTGMGFYGLENLSGIPGKAGASPIQNIGAYGVEVRDLIKEVEFLHLDSMQKTRLKAKDCEFGYRDSIFKRKLKNKAIILSVDFRLFLDPIINLSYSGLREFFTGVVNEEVTPMALRQAVLEIRSRKLPDPQQVGNAGSFFKNPLLQEDQYHELMCDYPGMPYFGAGAGKVKIPAAWLIEQCGWKGFRRGEAGVWDRQALILCNFGKASGEDILHLARQISQSVMDKFGIELIPEVNII